MVVEFTEEFNVETSTRGNYRDFIRRLRQRLGERSSHNRPALPVQHYPPTRFFDLLLRTRSHSVRFRFRMDNLYLLGFQVGDDPWLELDNRVPVYKDGVKTKETKLEHLITEDKVDFLGFEGSYGALKNTAKQNITDMRVGSHNLVNAINGLAESTDWQVRARSLVVVIMMISESLRLIPVSEHMANNFNNKPGTQANREATIQDWIMKIVTTWGSLCAVLLRGDAYPDEARFQLPENNIRVPPNNREVRTVADIVAIIGILLGLCFNPDRPKGLLRMTSDDDDEEQCFLGIPLLQVFSVQINNIDDEDPGQLYGTIVVDNGLYTEFLYNRTSDDYESIKPGQNASLIGPSQSVSAFGNVIIKLLLTDKDTFSWDDVIIDQAISWESTNMLDAYDELISQKLDGSGGSVTVNYAVLQNAAAARVIVSIEEGGEETTEVYGQVSACYDKWEDPKTTCLLFDRTSDNYVEVRRWQNIPMSRSVIAVPLDRSLKVTASLKDYDPISADDVIANGTVEIPVPDTIPSTTYNRINGENGNWVTVKVYWTSGL